MGVVNGSISTDKPDKYYDDEVELDKLIDKAVAKGKRILICIDDIAKTDAVVAFCSVYAKYIRAGKPVYFICTGLFSNMESFQYAFSFGDERLYPKTIDLHTCGGLVYLLNKDKAKLMEDLDVIRNMEKYEVEKMFDIGEPEQG